MNIYFVTTSYGTIRLRIEVEHLCLEIRVSNVFNPFEDLYVWLGKIKDSHLPAVMVTDEEGYGVKFIAKKMEQNFIEFCIEPWVTKKQTKPYLKTKIDSQKIIRAFYDGITDFIKNDKYNPIYRSSCITTLHNTNWSTLLDIDRNLSYEYWHNKLILSNLGHGYISNSERDRVLQNLNLEQQALLHLRDILIKIHYLFHERTLPIYSTKLINNLISKIIVLYKNFSIDIALGEINIDWYKKKMTELTAEYPEIDDRYRNKDRSKRNGRITNIQARMKTLKVGQLVDGGVESIKDYGLFINVGGVYALLHISCISQVKVENLEEVFQVGDWVRAIIIQLDIEKGRVTLSTKDLEVIPGNMLKNPLLVYETAEAMQEKYILNNN